MPYETWCSNDTIVYFKNNMFFHKLKFLTFLFKNFPQCHLIKTPPPPFQLSLSILLAFPYPFPYSPFFVSPIPALTKEKMKCLLTLPLIFSTKKNMIFKRICSFEKLRTTDIQQSEKSQNIEIGWTIYVDKFMETGMQNPQFFNTP